MTPAKAGSNVCALSAHNTSCHFYWLNIPFCGFAKCPSLLRTIRQWLSFISSMVFLSSWGAKGEEELRGMGPKAKQSFFDPFGIKMLLKHTISRTVNLLGRNWLLSLYFSTNLHYDCKYKVFILFVATRINLFHVQRGCAII